MRSYRVKFILNRQFVCNDKTITSAISMRPIWILIYVFDFFFSFACLLLCVFNPRCVFFLNSHSFHMCLQFEREFIVEFHFDNYIFDSLANDGHFFNILLIIPMKCTSNRIKSVISSSAFCIHKMKSELIPLSKLTFNNVFQEILNRILNNLMKLRQNSELLIKLVERTIFAQKMHTIQHDMKFMMIWNWDYTAVMHFIHRIELREFQYRFISIVFSMETNATICHGPCRISSSFANSINIYHLKFNQICRLGHKIRTFSTMILEIALFRVSSILYTKFIDLEMCMQCAHYDSLRTASHWLH